MGQRTFPPGGHGCPPAASSRFFVPRRATPDHRRSPRLYSSWIGRTRPGQRRYRGKKEGGGAVRPEIVGGGGHNLRGRPRRGQGTGGATRARHCTEAAQSVRRYLKEGVACVVRVASGIVHIADPKGPLERGIRE